MPAFSIDFEAQALEARPVHCSLWRFVGDPDELEARYLALLAEVPESNHLLHVAARLRDGLLIVDTCPSEDAFRTFFGQDGPGAALFARHGLAAADTEDHPVIRAFGRGSRLDV